MVQITMQLPDQLAERVQPIRHWLPVILEFTLLGLRTPAIATATEIIEFLGTDPTSQEILNYHVSERAQSRLQRLLALNSGGMLSEEEQHELDEMEKIEHVVLLLKAYVAEQMRQVN